MQDAAMLARVCSALGRRARAQMMLALMDGEAHTASDLALSAEVMTSTASTHLATLLRAGLVTVQPTGRVRLYRMASPEVAAAVEQLMALGTGRDSRPRERSAMRLARTCYDHLAGSVAVGIARELRDRGFVTETGRDFTLTDAGASFLVSLGVDVDAARTQKRMFARQCMDWTEREPHIAGALGAAIASRAFALDWFERIPGTRGLLVTEGGEKALREWFSLRVGELLASPMPPYNGTRAGRMGAPRQETT